MMCREDYNLARMSGMLDLSRDENAKHFLPRWLSDAPRTLGRPTGLPSANLPSETQAFLRRIYVNECGFVDDEEAVVELVGDLDRERVGVLRVELRHIDGMKEVFALVLHHEN